MRDNDYSHASVQEKHTKTTLESGRRLQSCDEDQRGPHSENNARCGYTSKKKLRGRSNLRWKDACERDMTEAGDERGNTANRAARRNKILN